MARRTSRNLVSKWQPVFNCRNRRIGRVRRVSSAFEEDQQWEVEGLDGVTFEDLFDAHKWLAEQDGMRYQVKTELSHRYWNGRKMGKEMDHEAGRVYAREIDAERAANQFDTGTRWDRVSVAVWRQEGWSR